MSADDDVTERILEGTTYDQAEVTVRRTFPVSLGGKIRLSVAVLVASVAVAPLLSVRQEYIRSIIEAQTASEVYKLTIVTLVLVGIVTTFGAAAVLVRQEYIVSRRSLSEEQARRVVRIEDVLMWFVLQGAAFVAIPLALSLLVVLSPETIDAMSASGVAVFSAAETVPADARVVSGLGPVLAAAVVAARSTLRNATGD